MTGVGGWQRIRREYAYIFRDFDRGGDFFVLSGKKTLQRLDRLCILVYIYMHAAGFAA
jgi:hypothetical protein